MLVISTFGEAPRSEHFDSVNHLHPFLNNNNYTLILVNFFFFEER